MCDSPRIMRMIDNSKIALFVCIQAINPVGNQRPGDKSSLVLFFHHIIIDSEANSKDFTVLNQTEC